MTAGVCSVAGGIALGFSTFKGAYDKQHHQDEPRTEKMDRIRRRACARLCVQQVHRNASGTGKGYEAGIESIRAQHHQGSRGRLRGAWQFAGDHAGVKWDRLNSSGSTGSSEIQRGEHLTLAPGGLAHWVDDTERQIIPWPRLMNFGWKPRPANSRARMVSHGCQDPCQPLRNWVQRQRWRQCGGNIASSL